MKKIYTLLSVAVLGMSAMATTPQLTDAQPLSANRAERVINFAANQLVKGNLQITKKTTVKADALTLDQICGDYYLTYTVELQGGTPYAGETTVTASGDDAVVVNFPFVNGSSILDLRLEATVDLSAGTLTFDSAQGSPYTGADLVFMHYANGWQVITEIVATYDAEAHALVFDQDDAFGLQASSGGWYTLFDTISMDQIIDDPNADPNEGWTSVGNAKFVDPWVIPAFSFDNGSDQWDMEYEVELQQNDEDKDLYRLVDPYRGYFPLADYNQSNAKHGYIQFNISDPDHVCFDIVESGWANTNQGITKMYCYNTLGLYVEYFGYTPEMIVEALGDELYYTKYEDGIINLNGFKEIDENGTESTVYDACFGIQGNLVAGFSWTLSDESPANMTGRITFPATTGIESANAESNNAPVEYFNLQGIRVANPEAGQIVIRRQGTEAQKVRVGF